MTDGINSILVNNPEQVRATKRFNVLIYYHVYLYMQLLFGYISCINSHLIAKKPDYAPNSIKISLLRPLSLVRGELMLKLKPLISAKAKENLVTHTKNGYKQLCQNSDNPVDTKKELSNVLICFY